MVLPNDSGMTCSELFERLVSPLQNKQIIEVHSNWKHTPIMNAASGKFKHI